MITIWVIGIDNEEFKTTDDKKIVFVQLVDGKPTQIQQLINILNNLKPNDFEFIVTNQYIEWNTVDNIITALERARTKDIKKRKNVKN